MAEVKAEFSFTKTETEAYQAKVELAFLLAFYREGGIIYAINDHVRPDKADASGFAYKATTVGQTKKRPPRPWPNALGGLYTDGSVIWEAVSLDSNSTDTITTVNIPATVPVGIDLGSPVIAGTRITLPISGGAAGMTYRISVEVTTSAGEVFEVKIDVTIKSI